MASPYNMNNNNNVLRLFHIDHIVSSKQLSTYVDKSIKAFAVRQAAITYQIKAEKLRLLW